MQASQTHDKKTAKDSLFKILNYSVGSIIDLICSSKPNPSLISSYDVKKNNRN